MASSHAMSWHVDDWDEGRTVDRQRRPLRKVTVYAWVHPDEVNLIPEVQPLDPLTAATRRDPMPLLIGWRYEWLVGEPHNPRSLTPITRHREGLPTLLPKDFTPAEWFTPGFHQRLLTAFWSIARRPLVATTEVALDKPQRRRHARAGVTTAHQPVRVLRFRTRELALASAMMDVPLAPDEPTPSPDATGVTGESPEGMDVVADGGEMTHRTYKHRWGVRGFWRNHWYPSLDTHRAIWIEAHIRGPEGAPLIGGERVFLVEGS